MRTSRLGVVSYCVEKKTEQTWSGQSGGPALMDVDHTSEGGQDGQELGGTSGRGSEEHA